MEIAITIVVAYFVAGIVCCYRGPMARKRKQEAFGIGKNVHPYRLLAFRAVLFLGIVLLWPVFLLDDSREMKAVGRRLELHAQRRPFRGLTFEQMAGVGVLFCRDCRRAQEVHSGTHGAGWFSKGFQCRTCGKFSSRTWKSQESPLSVHEADICNMRLQLENVPVQFRAAWIYDKQKAIRTIEAHMSVVPKGKWMSHYVTDMAKYQEMLKRVPAEELECVNALRDQMNTNDKFGRAGYEAALFCECGGELDSKAVLFCPGCRSANLSYNMTYIT